MSNIPACSQCAMENTYPEGANYVCADYGHEWPMVAAAAADNGEGAVVKVKDANGNVLSGLEVEVTTFGNISIRQLMAHKQHF